MKKNHKNLSIIIGLALLLGGAAYNANLPLINDKDSSDVSLKNVEQLALGEEVVIECAADSYPGLSGKCWVDDPLKRSVIRSTCYTLIHYGCKWSGYTTDACQTRDDIIKLPCYYY